MLEAIFADRPKIESRVKNGKKNIDMIKEISYFDGDENWNRKSIHSAMQLLDQRKRKLLAFGNRYSEMKCWLFSILDMCLCFFSSSNPCEAVEFYQYSVLVEVNVFRAWILYSFFRRIKFRSRCTFVWEMKKKNNYFRTDANQMTFNHHYISIFRIGNRKIGS